MPCTILRAIVHYCMRSALLTTGIDNISEVETEDYTTRNNLKESPSKLSVCDGEEKG